MATPFEAAKAEANGGVSFEAFGERFRAQDPGAMAFVEWAASSELDIDSASPAEVMAANAAIFHYLRAIVADEDWHRFRLIARQRRASGDELLRAVLDASSALAGRPTGPSSDSPAPPETNGRLSKDGSSSPAARSRSKT